MQNVWDGYPPSPSVSGWHWIEDAVGLRPLLWRGGDWPEAADRFAWQDGFAVCAASDMRSARYLGPVAMPDRVDRRFRAQLLLGAA